MGKTNFSQITQAFFNNAVLLHGHWFMQCCKNEPMARQRCCTVLWRRCLPNFAKACQNGQGVWLYKRPLRHRILRFLLLQWRWLLFDDLWDSKPFSPLTSWLAALKPLSTCSSRGLPVPCRHPANAQKSSKRTHFFSPCCKCRTVTVAWTGAAHTETALTEMECPHCVDMSLASLCLRIAYFLESDSAPCALPLSSSLGPVRKKQPGRGSQRPEMGELTPDQILRSSLSPSREADPVFYSRADQHPSTAVSDMVSFGGSEDEILDDSMSLSAFDGEELSSSIYGPALPQSGKSSKPKPGMDAELFHVLSRAVDELGLDECILPGRHQAPHQRASPFFPEIHEELTRSWHAPTRPTHMLPLHPTSLQ